MRQYRIGVNIVSFLDDDIESNYTRAVYLQQLRCYEKYLPYIGYLEFSHVRNLSPEDGMVIGESAREIGFIPWSIHSEHLNIGEDVKNYLRIQKQAAEVCAALGCRIMVCHLPNLSPYVDFERDLEIIAQVGDLANACGVKLAVETCVYSLPGHACLSDAELVIRIVETLNRPDIGINLDTGHCFIGQTEKNPAILEKILKGQLLPTLPSLVQRIGTKILTTHLQDNFGLNDDHQPPGFGYIDWTTLIPSLLASGYQGPLMMELTGMENKQRRTMPQLRQFSLEKELIIGSSYLQFLVESNQTAF